MDFIKKNHLLNIFLLFTVFNAQTMDQAKSTTKKKPSKLHRIGTRIRDLASVIEDALFGRAPNLERMTTSKQSKEEAFVLFAELPKDMQNLIFGLLATGADAETLEGATQVINQLAQVNKELNELINNPDFCLRTIKILSDRFNCSNMTACYALQTQEAKKRLALQQELHNLCSNSELSKASIQARLLHLSKNNVDLDFTYGQEQTTVLLLALFTNRDVAHCLITAGADPEHASLNNITPLSAAMLLGDKSLINSLAEAINKKYQKK